MKFEIELAFRCVSLSFAPFALFTLSSRLIHSLKDLLLSTPKGRPEPQAHRRVVYAVLYNLSSLHLQCIKAASGSECLCLSLHQSKCKLKRRTFARADSTHTHSSKSLQPVLFTLLLPASSCSAPLPHSLLPYSHTHSQGPRRGRARSLPLSLQDRTHTHILTFRRRYFRSQRREGKTEQPVTHTPA